MKKAGLLILVIGILTTIFNGLNYVTNEVVLDSGSMSITRDQSHGLTWSPLIGILFIVIGGCVFLAGIKRNSEPVKSHIK